MTLFTVRLRSSEFARVLCFRNVLVQHDLSPHSCSCLFFPLHCFLRYIILSLSGGTFVSVSHKYVEKRNELQSHFT